MTSGVVPLNLTCSAPRTGRCTGTLALTRRSGRRTVSAGSARFSIPGRRTQAVRVRLPSSTRSIVRRGALRVTQTSTSRVTVGIPSVRTAGLQIVRARALGEGLGGALDRVPALTG